MMPLFTSPPVSAQTTASLSRSTVERLSERRYAAAGTRAYVVGTLDGDFPPMGWHIRGEMGGVWAHPLKLLDGYWFALNGQRLGSAERFTTGTGYVQMEFPVVQGSAVTRTEFVPDDLPVVLIGLTLRSAQPQTITLSMTAHSDLMLAYPWGWSQPLSAADAHQQDEVWFDRQLSALVFHEMGTSWYALVALSPAAAVGTLDSGVEDTRLLPEPTPFGHPASGELHLSVPLGETEVTIWAAVAGSAQSRAAAEKALQTALADPESLLRAKIAGRRQLLGRSAITVPDAALQAAFDWGKLNLADLRMTVDNMRIRDVQEGRAYPLPLTTLAAASGVAAGLPDYYSFFAADIAYTTYALIACGQWEAAMAHLLTLRDASRAVNGATGKVIHELTTDGAVYYGTNAHYGNTNETAQFAIAVELLWRWSGDETFLAEMYAFVSDGLRYVLAALDSSGDPCPEGRGMVEREGMAGQTLDVAAYTWEALNALARMAAERHDDAVYHWARAGAAALHRSFDSAWWMPQETLYADSLDDCAQPQIQVQQRHWINAVPMEVAVAPPEQALAALVRLETPTFTGANGLYHTGIGGGPDGRGEARVWTLPNAVMAVAEANYGRLEAALPYMRAIAHNLDLEMPGALPEILPSPDYDPFGDLAERAMFMQAWSSYGVQWPLVRHFLGVDPHAPTRVLCITPQLPADWPSLAVRQLRVGEDTLSVTVEQAAGEYRTTVELAAGWTLFIGHTLPAASRIRAVTLDGAAVDYTLLDTTRGREVRVQTPSGDPHTVVVRVR
ncbi:MAG: glycogen debranching protein [Chloroflexi bacterium]|nr:glycogen debranching protein [Chloroflexota bacterium]